ncbi:MAG: hypothetical protein ACYSTL_04545, partial [Planctomycetota bacterium]
IRKGEGFQIKAADPRMDQIIQRFEYLAVNGYTEVQRSLDPKTQQRREVIARPYPVHIPDKTGDNSGGSLDSIGDAERR